MSREDARRRRAPNEREVLSATAALRKRITALTPLTYGAEPVSIARTLQDIRDGADTLFEELRRSEGERATDLRAALVDALDLEQHLERLIHRRREARRTRLREGLDRLRPSSDPVDLIDRACASAVQCCSARRATLSRISDGVWSPWKADLGPGGEALAADLGEVGPLPLEALPIEAEVVRQRRPVLVEDPQGDPRIHSALRALYAAPFVIAPIAPDDTVIGLLHLDRHGEKRTVDRDDRDIAWAFAEGFGRVYERAVFRRRLELQAARVRDANRQSEQLFQAVFDESRGREPTLARRSDQQGPAAPGNVLADFTAREREVMELVALGLSNEAIGARLVITPATAKSHVRKILRKLGAANRSQAITKYAELR